MLVKLDKVFKINIDFENVYIINEKIQNYNKKILINTSTRIFDGKKYDTLYIIEPKVAYLIPLPEKYQNKFISIQNYLIETGIILQPSQEYILMYNTNENLIYLNKNISVCNIKEV